MNKIFSTQRVNKLSWLVILMSIFIGGILRFGTLFNYNWFQGDQAFHGGFIMDIWQGKMPTLGSTTSGGGHSLTPLHYYLFWIFTIFGPNPVFQALPNAIFSFLSIPALIYFVYRLLNKTEKPRRLFLSATAGLWWTFFYNDVLFAGFEWNPNPIAYFVLSFILLIDLIVNKYIDKSKVIVTAWVMLGINTALFTSLHTTTLLLYPIIFSVFVLYNIFKTKKIWLPLFSVLSFAITLTPYWIGEITTRGQNTKALVKTLLNSQSTLTILEKLNKIFFNYFEIGPLMYFDNTIAYLSYGFLGLVLVISLFHFKGNAKMWFWYIVTNLFYFLIMMNYAGKYYEHYKEVFWSLPIVLTVVTLNYILNIENKYTKTVSLIIVLVCVILSVYINSRNTYHIFQQKYGTTRDIGVNDYIDIFNSVNPNQAICTPYISNIWDRNALNFIDKYNTKKTITVTRECLQGSIEIMPKYTFPAVSLKQIPISITPEIGAKVIKDCEAYYLIQR